MTTKKSKSCSIRDLAKYVNVSPGTVSRVLNNKASNIKITEATKKRIFAAVKELNYSPNIHAKRLFTNKSLTIGVVIPEEKQLVNYQHTFSDFNLAESLSGIENTATVNDYRILLLVRTEKFIQEKEYLKLFREKCIDGLIFWGVGTDTELNQELLAEKLPFVLANADSLASPFPTVINDNVEGSYQITEYLLKKGRKKIAYLQGKINSPVHTDRKTGFAKALKKYGAKLPEKYILKGDYSLESGYHETQKALNAKLDFDGLIAENDMMAIGAIRAITEKGLAIPEDVAVVGADNIRLAEFAGVPLTTYSTDMYTLGSEAMVMLIALMNNRKTPRQIVIPTKLVIRNSA